ncbi:MAG: Flp pilus assembly protein CpaB [Selenomonadaceae bacterium]|nr:Flp pilus assembly protein CpaB [Selenomonadaceae bacterium]
MLQKIINKLNDLRPKQLMILAGIAAVLMFAAIYAGMSMMAGKEVVINPEPPPPKEEKVIETKAVVVAKVNIPARTRIQESMLQIKELPIEMLPEGVITSFNDVKDVQVKVSIFAGDVLTVQKVFADRSEEGFVGAIPADCRAVSINVNEITSVAGFAKPGDKVDLLLVEKSNYSVTTNVLLQNVPLLSVNQDMTGANIVDESGGTTSAIHNPTIATFALPPEDVLKLISASKLGEIYMMLRPANPRATYVAEMEYTIDSINKPQPVREPEPTPVIPANPVPDLPQIPMVPVTPKFDIIQGDELTQSSEETAQVQSFAGNSSNSALPAIPSRSANTENVAPPVPNVPLSGSPIMNQIGN